MLEKISRKQILSLVIVSCVNFFCSACVSLQAPFYPAEAEKKGASATEYGLVFGVYELVQFLFSPIVGKIVDRVGAKLLLSSGMALGAVSVILFGQLDLVQDHIPFITLSFVLRIVESIGTTSAFVSGFSLIGNMFPDNIATIFATLEIFYGCGYIVGPTLGGVLYSIGGFQLPFTCVGVISGIVAISILIFIPNVTDKTIDLNRDGYFTKACKTPAILLNAFGVVVFAMSAGFYTATLEPHIRQFHIPAVLMGFMFIISGGTYAFFSPIFGRLIDTVVQPKTLLFVGCAFNILSFSIVGPLPFLPIPSTLVTCIIALFLHGFGLAAGSVSTFINSIRIAIKSGFPASILTYGIMSGIWNSAYALGACIGPSVAGVLYDLVGFQYATLFVIFAHLTLITTEILYFVKKKLDRRKMELKNDKMFYVGTDDDLNHLTKCMVADTIVHSEANVQNGSCKNYGTI